MQNKRPFQAKRSAQRVIKLTVLSAFFALLLISILSQYATEASATSQAAKAKNPLPATEKNIALGLDHFNAHCASCHGITGKADTDKGRAVGAADLTSDEVQSNPDAELFRTISRGVPGTAMPAFAKTHKPVEIWQTVLFLRKLPTLTPEERAKLEAAIPAGARHKHGGGQPQKHPEAQPQPQHEHPPQAPAKPPAKQPPTTEHQHRQETPQTQQAQKPAQPEHTHEPGKQPAQPLAQTQPQQEHRHPAQPSTPQPGEMKEHARHDTGQMHGAHDMSAMMSTITGGPYKSMHAIGSGTGLLPATTPAHMWMWMKGDLMLMLHSEIKAGFNHQGGPRGVNKAESQNMLMVMAEREAGAGRLMLRGMFSAERWTAPRRGFPELFQTGETFKGRPIIDAQHPHDLFMELAAAFTVPLSEHLSIQLYGGPVGEPALGPVAFMHRASAMENPAAPLAHHLQDSTHIAHGVFTTGVTAWRFKLEGSIFRGAEPDENRETIDLGKLDSWSGRIWFAPTRNWAMQFSYGHLVNPEAIEPGDIKRTTASISYNRPWSDGNWATTLVWGRNREEHGRFNGYLLESTANFLDKNYLYTRMELVDKEDDLLDENIFGRRGLREARPIGNGFDDEFEPTFRVGAFTFGGVRDILVNSKLRVGIGADVTFYHVPDGVKPIYGLSPTSFHLFLRVRPGKMSH